MKDRCRIVALMVPMLALALPSCGRRDGPPLYPVRGKVIYKGQPAAGATVMLRRQDPEPNTTPLVPVGPGQRRGEILGGGRGAGQRRPGREVCRADPVEDEGRGRHRGPKPAPKKGRRTVVLDKPELIPDRLEGRYMNPEKSPFRVEVKPGDNDLEPFDVSK